MAFVLAYTHDFLFAGNSYDGTEFHQTTWIESGDSNYNNPRCAMLDNLQKYRLTIGLSKDEVFKLLGQPDREGSNSVAYCIGRNNGFLNDSEWFVLDVDEQEVVRDFNIRSPE